jgi:hypothetical protein
MSLRLRFSRRAFHEARIADRIRLLGLVRFEVAQILAAENSAIQPLDFAHRFTN